MHILTWLLATTTLTVTSPADVNSAACAYRVEVYSQFHMERDAYDQRIKVADELLHHWEAAGRPYQDSDVVAQWFQDAHRAVAQGRPEPTTPSIDHKNTEMKPPLKAKPLDKPADESSNSALDTSPVPVSPADDEFTNFNEPADRPEPANAKLSEDADCETTDGEKTGAIDGIGRAIRGLIAP